VLLLNSDTVVRSGALAASVAAMEADQGIGVLSCKLVNRDGSIQNAARKFPSPARFAVASAGLQRRWPAFFGWADCEDPGWDRESTKRDVEWVGGAFMMIRADLLDKIGGLDERFFFYGEDIEFCHRVRRHGARVHYDPAGVVMHLSGASSDPTRMPAAARNKMAWEARYLVQERCYGRPARWLAWCIDLVNLTTRTVVMKLAGRSGDPRCLEMLDALRLIKPGAGRAA
jgi:GT2 family glycosyltransferase